MQLTNARHLCYLMRSTPCGLLYDGIVDFKSSSREESSSESEDTNSIIVESEDEDEV